MFLHGPFVWGAYIYIDTTPSKNALIINLNAIALHDQCDLAAHSWRAGRGVNASLAHAGRLCPMPYAQGGWLWPMP